MKLCIPLKTLHQHAIALGKTGAGKSSALRHCVECLLDNGNRICIVDPKGDWWGLSADGSRPAFPVVLVGDFKNPEVNRIPITGTAGAAVAELVLGSAQTFVIGMRGWRQSHMTQFWIDFAETIFNKSGATGELTMVIDEVHNFAQKGRVLSPQAGESLHWANRLMSEGRGLGLTFLIASQRPQKVHNDTLTCCETLIAMKVIHASDRQAVADWIDGCGSKDKGREVLDSLAALRRGEAWVWSPEEHFGPVLVQFPFFETFDSFAPPEKQKKARLKVVKLDELKEKLTSVVQEAERNDPAKLRAEIHRLKREFDDKEQHFQNDAEIEESVRAAREDGFKEGFTKGFEDAKDRCRKFNTRMAGVLSTIGQVNTEVQAFRVDLDEVLKPDGKLMSLEDMQPAVHRAMPGRSYHKPSPPTAKVSVEHANGSTVEGLTGTQQRIMDVIYMLKERGITPDRECVARWLSIHPNGSRYNGDLAELRRRKMLDGLTITQGSYPGTTMSTGIDGLHAALESGTQRSIVTILEKQGNAALSREQLAQMLGIHPNGSRFNGDLAWLRTMKVIPERGAIMLLPQAYN